MQQATTILRILSLCTVLLAAPAIAQELPVLFVDADATGANDGSSWADAYTDLQNALTAARDNSDVAEIWVAGGAYHPAPPNGQRYLSFDLIDGVGLYGGFAGWEAERDQRDAIVNVTVLSGDLNGDDGPDFANNEENSRRVVRSLGSDETAVLDGFQITAGHADDYDSGGGLQVWGNPTIANCVIWGNMSERDGGGVTIHTEGAPLARCTITANKALRDGGGVWCSDGENVTLTACTISQNSASRYGGGVSVPYYGTLSLVDCSIMGNSAERGGGLQANGDCARLSGCVFSGNFAETRGGAVHFYEAIEVVNCVFDGNASASSGGAVYCSGSGGHMSFIDCQFSGNLAGGYGGALKSRAYNNSFVLTNCRMAGNWAGHNGGAIDAWTATGFTLTNCTISGNSAGQSMGGVDGWDAANGVVANCIVRENTPGQLDLHPGGVVRFSNIQGGWTGEGNINVDPAFLGGPSGVWTADGTYDPQMLQVTFTDGLAVWSENELVGKLLNPDDSQPLQFQIIANTATTVTVRADWATIEDGASWVAAGAHFEINDYRLGAGSPCIDAGDNSAVPADDPDLDGDADRDEYTPYDVDFKPRLLDDFDTPDSGNGAAPIVDMGAYEFGAQYFLVHTPPVSVHEGGTAQVGVTLATDPAGTVEVTTSCLGGDPDVYVQSGATLVFDSDNYDTPQLITLAADCDADFLHGVTTFRISADGITHADFRAYEVDDTPVPPVVFVDAGATGADNGLSWSDAFTRLRPALEAVRAQSTTADYWVAAGTYTPAEGDADRAASFELRAGDRLLGGFAGWETQADQRAPTTNVTILSGDLNGDDGPDFANTSENSYHVATINGGEETTVLDGFRVTGGNAAWGQPSWSGGGLLISAGSAVVANCTFESNQAGSSGGGAYAGNCVLTATECAFVGNAVDNDGGGLYLDYSCLAPTLSECAFIGNVASYGGGLYSVSNGAKFIRCEFSENEAVMSGGGSVVRANTSVMARCTLSGNRAGVVGGGILADHGPLILEACTLTENSADGDGGAVYAYCNDATFANCVFTLNAADKGGAIWNSRSLTILDCLLVGNVATSTWGAGGGVYTRRDYDSAQTHIVNCTFADNQAPNGYGGGFFSGSINEALTSCIFWNNADVDGIDESAQIHRTTDLLAVDYCCVEGLTGELGGIGNIGDDPLFADALLGRYHLTAASPCVDAGDPYADFGGRSDRDGEFRVWDGDGDGVARIDIGVDEFGSFLYGDLNCDGAANMFDIAPLVLSISDVDAYELMFPGCQPLLADTNGDGSVNTFDIDPFVDILTSQ